MITVFLFMFKGKMRKYVSVRFKSHREFAVHNFKFYNEVAYIFDTWLERILFNVLKCIKIFNIQYRCGFAATNFDFTQNGPPWKRYSSSKRDSR